MGDIKLSSPRVVVVRDGFDPLELQTANPDLIRWDETARRHRWGKADEAPMLWLTFVSWAAARRVGAIPPEYEWEKWKAEVLDIRSLDEDEDDELGTPTQPGLEPG